VNIIVFLLGCTVPEETPKEGSFSALTYNVHGLPPEVTGDDTSGRMEAIAPLLNNYDVVGVQEDFIDENHQILSAGVSHGYEDWFNDTVDDSRVYGSGLSLFSTLPILDNHNEHYEGCYGLVTNSSDCFASKGLQLVEVQLTPTIVVHLYNTHLEAGGGEEDNEVRSQQVAHIVDSLNSFSADFPVIVMGDFNLRYSDPEDVPLLEQLIQQGNLTDGCASVDCEETDHIDRILVRGDDALDWQVDQWNREEEFIDAEGLGLSDHPAISIHVAWTRK
jgi:endonuclease/exonuclease/phosphatase family metal-dependent hydrolase